MSLNTAQNRIDLIRDLYDQGKTQVEVAKAVGCSQAYVSQALSGRHSGIAKAIKEGREAAQEAADAAEYAKYQVQRAKDREQLAAAPDTAARKIILQDRHWKANLDFYHSIRDITVDGPMGVDMGGGGLPGRRRLDPQYNASARRDAAGLDLDLIERTAAQIEDEYQPSGRSVAAIMADLDAIDQDVLARRSRGEPATAEHGHAMITLINEVELLPFGAFPDEVKPVFQIPLSKRPHWMPDIREPLTAAGQTELHLLHTMGRNRAALKAFWQRASTVALTPRRIAHMYDELITLEYAAKQAKVEHAQAQLDAFTTIDHAQLFV